MASSAGTMPNTGRWGWYKDHEGREFRRVSTLIKKVDTNTGALDEWKKRQVLLGAARRDDIVVGVKALGAVPAAGWSQQTKKQLGAWAEECMTAAGSDSGRTLGTAMHDLTERVDRGEPIEDVCRGLAGAQQHDLRAYAKLRELNGWRSVEIERTVVCDELDVAGSFDRIDVIPGLSDLLGQGVCQHGHDHREMQWDGEQLAVIVDVKTEDNPLLNGLHIGPQLAIYSRAKRMWLPADLSRGDSVGPQYVDAPCVRQDVAVIVHVRDGKAIPYFVDLNAGWEAAQAAARQLEREKAAKKWFAPVPGIVEPKPAELSTDVAVAKQYADPYHTPHAGQKLTSEIMTPLLATAVLDASKMTALGQDYRVGDTVTVAGIEFTKHAEMPATQRDHEQVIYERVNGLPDGHLSGVMQVAERGADGLVRWKSATQNQAPVARLLDLIRQAPDLPALAELYASWDAAGNAWDGDVAAAGEARRRIIECPQKALHTSGTCACGWFS